MQLELKAIVLLGRVNTFVQRESLNTLYLVILDVRADCATSIRCTFDHATRSEWPQLGCSRPAKDVSYFARSSFLSTN